MPTYKLKAGYDAHDRIIPGIGRTINGVIKTNATIESSIFELVPEAEAAPAAPTTQSSVASATTPVNPPQPASQQIANKETN